MGRMKEGNGYCLPDFIKKDKSIFGIDNIDHVIDTVYGGSFNGAIIVIDQEDDDEAEPLNPPLKIPAKATPVDIEIVCLKDAAVTEKSVKFASLMQQKSVAELHTL